MGLYGVVSVKASLFGCSAPNTSSVEKTVSSTAKDVGTLRCRLTGIQRPRLKDGKAVPFGGTAPKAYVGSVPELGAFWGKA